jgi:FtsH-binding integral membrane protein
LVAADAAVDERALFIRKTYAHLLGAVVAFIAIEAAILNSPLAERMMELISANTQIGWLVVLGAFIGVSWLAESWARSTTSIQTQYLGLGLYVVAEAVIFVPLLYVAEAFGPPNVIATAGLLTGLIFFGLTAAVFVTRADLSYLRVGLGVAALAALGVIVASALFGFQLGTLFVALMIVLACGYILYDTSNVLHHYRIGQHVAASLALFASLALLFWYVLRLLMALNSRD